MAQLGVTDIWGYHSVSGAVVLCSSCAVQIWDLQTLGQNKFELVTAAGQCRLAEHVVECNMSPLHCCRRCLVEVDRCWRSRAGSGNLYLLACFVAVLLLIPRSATMRCLLRAWGLCSGTRECVEVSRRGSSRWWGDLAKAGPLGGEVVVQEWFLLFGL